MINWLFKEIAERTYTKPTFTHQLCIPLNKGAIKSRMGYLKV